MSQSPQMTISSEHMVIMIGGETSTSLILLIMPIKPFSPMPSEKWANASANTILSCPFGVLE
jgi:hypothetical protein